MLLATERGRERVGNGNEVDRGSSTWPASERSARLQPGASRILETNQQSLTNPSLNIRVPRIPSHILRHRNPRLQSSIWYRRCRRNRQRQHSSPDRQIVIRFVIYRASSPDLGRNFLQRQGQHRRPLQLLLLRLADLIPPTLHDVLGQQTQRFR